MKKVWKILILAFSVIGALCAFAACDNSDVEETAPTHVHTYSRIVEQSPTCSQKGVRAHLQCIWCKKLFTDDENPQEVTEEALEMEMIPHSEVIDAGEKPTCTKNGWTEGKHCSECLTYLVGRDMIPATGHKEVVDAGVKATCAQDGKTDGKHCSVCNTVIKKQEVIPATGHKIVIDAAQELSCTQDGLTEGSHCSVCNTVIEEQTVTPATGHVWNTNNSCDTCHLVLDYTKGLQYTLNGDGNAYSVTDIGSASGDIVIPAYHEGKPVTAIGQSAFSACTDLTGITIPDTVTQIGESAFMGCSRLTGITIPKGVTVIGKSAFENCTGLIEISISNTVTTIEERAFRYCSKLTKIEIPNSVERIGKHAFYGCDAATITVERGNENYFVSGNCLIETATKTLLRGHWDSVIPVDGSVTRIEDSAFLGCWGLTPVIPNTVTSIGDYAFASCDFMSITIPSAVTDIGAGAFMRNDMLQNIVIPENITCIGESAFSGCRNLTKIVFEGTMAQWETRQQNFGEDWNLGAGNYTVQCSDGTLDKDGKEKQV